MVGFVKFPVFRLVYSVLLAQQVCGLPTIICVLTTFISEDCAMYFGVHSPSLSLKSSNSSKLVFIIRCYSVKDIVIVKELNDINSNNCKPNKLI